MLILGSRQKSLEVVIECVQFNTADIQVGFFEFLILWSFFIVISMAAFRLAVTLGFEYCRLYSKLCTHPTKAEL
jgi:hypothetical protein